MDEDRLIDETKELLRQYHRIRKERPLSESQQKFVCQHLKNWKLFRSDKEFTAYLAYGVWEYPIVFFSEDDVDEYVIDDMDVDDDFVYCTEQITITGREYGLLCVEW